MGLYNDLQNDLGEAFDNDLLDATSIIGFITYSGVYDPNTMVNVRTEVITDIRAINLKDIESENADDSTLMDKVHYIILDSDRNGFNFEIDMTIKDGTDEYKLVSFKTDPVNASWEVFGRRLG